MRVRDHPLDAAQAAPCRRAQELGPEEPAPAKAGVSASQAPIAMPTPRPTGPARGLKAHGMKTRPSRFCGLRDPREHQSGLHNGPLLDSGATRIDGYQLTVFASLAE